MKHQPPNPERTTWPARSIYLATALALTTATMLMAQTPLSPKSTTPITQPVSHNAAFAQELTLPQALALAALHHPGLAAARLEQTVFDGRVLQSRAYPNPELSLSSEDTRADTRSHSLELTLPLELGGKRHARMQLAEQERQLGETSLALRQNDLRTETMAAFFALLSAQEALVLAQENLALAQQSTRAAALRVAAGKVAPAEENRARLAEAQNQLALLQAQGQQQSAHAQLVYVLGPSAPAFTHVAAPVLPLAAAPALEHAPALQQARQAVQVAQAAVEQARSQQWPDARVSLGLKRNNELQRNQLLLGVAVPLPLFDRKQGDLASALARETQARAELAAVEQRSAAQVQQIHNRLLSLQAEAQQVQQHLLPTAQALYRSALLGFENGKFGLLEVLDAQRSVQDARAHALRVQNDIRHEHMERTRLLGVLAQE